MRISEFPEILHIQRVTSQTMKYDVKILNANLAFVQEHLKIGAFGSYFSHKYALLQQQKYLSLWFG